MDTISRFLEDYVSRVAPLERDVRVAYWNATTTGRASDFERYASLDVELQKIHADKADFEKLTSWRSSNATSDPLMVRQLDLLHMAFLRNQIDPELNESMTRLSSEIIHEFNTFRVQIDGKILSSNDVRTVLRTSVDSEYRRRVWETDKAVGARVRDKLLKLVHMRNQAATSLGFDNYYTMSLALSEQDPDELLTLFDQLDALTKEPFADLKANADAVLAARYGIRTEELRAWHYEDPFFQDAPHVHNANLDDFYETIDVIAAVDNFYKGIGLDASDIIERSDLFERDGKEQHAYCMDIDRNGDIRVLANVTNNENWTGTMLHELGHAVYDKYIDGKLPYVLREHAHVLATEAVAMLFGRLSKEPDWIVKSTGTDPTAVGKLTNVIEMSQRLGQIVFARWCQVMVRFEQALYANPEADLDQQWWQLVRRYQNIDAGDRPYPDWAAKIHVVSAPVYYHNYMLGELFASQLDNHIQRRVLGQSGERGSMVDDRRIGDYMKESVFLTGKQFRWDELVQRSTGERLTPDYFVEQFVSRRTS